MPSRDARALQTVLLAGRTDLEPDAVGDVSGALNVLLADMIALYLKTKNFHCMFPDRIFATTICCWTSRAIRFSVQRTIMPKEFARSAARRFARLDTSAVCSALSTMIPIS